MESLCVWEPCFERREQGIAFFDDILIESDRMSDPRWDRVLPVFEEEQVFQWRMMRPLLARAVSAHRSAGKPAPRVLDLGTGSGVFAICAASLGCEVVAIDVSQRAIDYARQNVEKNERVIARNGIGGRTPKIEFVHGDYRRMDLPADFDFVVINPPFNPTAPGLQFALHADAGEKGQDKFVELLDIFPKYLKPGGICFGTHMFVTSGKDGRFTCEPEMRSKLASFSLVYTSVFAEPFHCRKFIAEEYKRVTHDRNSSGSAVAHYINQAFKDDEWFDLIYFEASKGSTAGELSLSRRNCQVSIGRTWEDRIGLHRTIAECSKHYAAFPAEEFLFNVRGIPELINVEQGDAEKVPGEEAATRPGKRKRPWKDSVLSLVDQWISNAKLFSEKSAFACVLVDTAPWYPSTNSPKAFLQDCAVWLSKYAVGSDAVADRLARQLVENYQVNTQAMQETLLGPLYHPSFTGKSEPGHWKDIRFTSRMEGGSRAADLAIIKYGREYASQIEREYADNVFDLDIAAQRIDGRTDAILYRSCASLEELKSPHDVTEVEAAVRERVKRLRAEESCWQDYPDEKLAECDLSMCHQALHIHLDRVCRPAFPVGILDAAACSFVASIPISIGSFDAHADRGKIPDSYRGGIWVYVICMKPWTIDTERTVHALCRAVYLIADTKYSYLAAKEIRRSEADAKQRQFAHMVQGQTNALAEAVEAINDDRVRANADAALRKLQFSINIWDDRPLQRIADATVDWCVCVNDAAASAVARLRDRVADKSRLLDLSLKGKYAEHDRIRQRLNHPDCLLAWRDDVDAFLKFVNFDMQLERLVAYRPVWSEGFEQGLYTYVLMQAFFHAAVFSAVHPMNGEDSAVRLRFEKTSDTEMLVIESRAFPGTVIPYKSKDWLTLKQIEQRLRQSGARNAVIEQHLLEDHDGRLWFNYSLLNLNCIVGN